LLEGSQKKVALGSGAPARDQGSTQARALGPLLLPLLLLGGTSAGAAHRAQGCRAAAGSGRGAPALGGAERSHDGGAGGDGGTGGLGGGVGGLGAGLQENASAASWQM
jgi:hypothetical protein